MGATRVSGVTTGLSVSGTLYARLGDESITIPDDLTEPPTGFASVSVALPNCSVGISYTQTYVYQPNIGRPDVRVRYGQYLDPDDPLIDEMMAILDGNVLTATIVWLITAGASAGWADGSGEGAATHHFVCYNPDWSGDPGNGAGWLGEMELSLPYTLTLTGYTLKRSSWGSIPTARSHMHLTDAYIKDTWAQTPDAAATASIDGLSITGYRRDAYPPGTSDAEIDDYGVITPSVSYSMSVRGPVLGGNETICSFTASGANFDGLNHTACTTGAKDAIMAVGSGSEAALKSANGGWLSGGWGGVAFIEHRYSWYPEFELWEGEALDPELWAGYYSWKVVDVEDESGITYQTWAIDQELKHYASQLPSYEPPWQGWDGLGIGTPGRAPSPRNWNFHFSPVIDEFWALNNWLCPQRVNYEGGEEEPFLIETMHDRYVPIHVPGCDGGVTAPYQKVVYNVSVREPSLFPLAEDRNDPEADPLDRLEQTGTLAAYKDLTRESVYPPLPEDRDGGKLAWYIPEQSVYLDTASEPTGNTPPIGGLALNLQTRYWDRLAILPQVYDAWPKDWRWYWRLRRNLRGAGLLADPPDPREPAYGEDVYSWHGCSWLNIRLTKPRSAVMTLTLTVTYREAPVITDPHYTCGSWRAEEYEYTLPGTQTVTYTIPVEGHPGERASYLLEGEYVTSSGDTVEHPVKVYETVDAVVDLLRPTEGTVPEMWVVDRWSLDGLTIPFDDYHDPETGLLVIQGGYLEIADIILCADQGFDHTGRDVREQHTEEHPTYGSLGGMKLGESWDFQGDWAFQWAYRDGFPRLLRIPDDPFRNRGPEDGLGCIEPVEHCPEYTGPAGQLDYARELSSCDHLRLHEGTECLVATGAVDEMTKSYWKGADNPEVMGIPRQYWVTGHMHHSGNAYGLTAAVVCSGWEIPGGTGGSVIHLRKTMGGSAWAFLTTPDGKRFTSNDLAELRDPSDPTQPATATLVIWRRVTYVDAEDDPIAQPGDELPEAGRWHLYKQGQFALDRHGLLRFPGLHPSDSRFNNPIRSQTDASDQTDRVKSEYMAQGWLTDDWQDYDLDDPDQLAAMADDPGCLVSFAAFGGVQPRMIVDLTGSASAASPGERIDAKYAEWGALVVVRPSTVLWPDEEESIAEYLLVDQYTTHAHPRQPERTARSTYVLNPAVCFDARGHLWIAAQSTLSARLLVMRTDSLGRSLSVVATQAGYSHPALAPNPHAEGVVVVARENTTGQLTLFAIRDSVLVRISDVGECGEYTSGVGVLETGEIHVARVLDSTVYWHVSADDGETWRDVDQVLHLDGRKHLAMTINPHTGDKGLVARRDSDGVMQYVAVHAHPMLGNWVTSRRGDIGVCDEVTGAVIIAPDGTLQAVRVYQSRIHWHESGDDGRTWTELTA